MYLFESCGSVTGNAAGHGIHGVPKINYRTRTRDTHNTAGFHKPVSYTTYAQSTMLEIGDCKSLRRDFPYTLTDVKGLIGAWPANGGLHPVIASRQLIRLHLGKQNLRDYQDLLWDYPKDLEQKLKDADISLPDSDFVLPCFTLKTKAPLSLARIDDEDDDNSGSSDSDDNVNADEAPPAKKPRLSTTKGRAGSVESVTPSAPAKHTKQNSAKTSPNG
ncbi:hypothetical protein C8F04DRAFT_1183981 [Mycena alexandri]|uniref:Uncharacterized protein n=1 Tax=Mycena alexandri TaxID=1745969 RepID=A0AAD6X634_9AGAR|nr:hypothetical protein C8F04DRAFT_1183981 [Mycena alexandri]